MPLEHSQAQKVEQWLNSKLPNLRCPLCQGAAWEMTEVVGAPVIKGTTYQMGQSVPVVQIHCKNCANVLSFAAMPMGLMQA